MPKAAQAVPPPVPPQCRRRRTNSPVPHSVICVFVYSCCRGLLVRANRETEQLFKSRVEGSGWTVPNAKQKVWGTAGPTSEQTRPRNDTPAACAPLCAGRAPHCT